jgi:NIMA (never in mitosis gene a)-related kinase
VEYTESFEEQGHLYIVMGHADGGDLATKIRRREGKLFDEDEIWHDLIELALAIKHIHDRKILHRDLKTANVFLMKDGTVKLGDFGVSSVLDATCQLCNTRIGTPFYLSPEIVQGRNYNSKTDIWSFGCIAYELCTLKRAFHAKRLDELMVAIAKGRYTPISEVYSTDLRDFVYRLLTIDPIERPNINDLLRLPVLRQRLTNFADDAAGSALESVSSDGRPNERARKEFEERVRLAQLAREKNRGDLGFGVNPGRREPAPRLANVNSGGSSEDDERRRLFFEQKRAAQANREKIRGIEMGGSGVIAALQKIGEDIDDSPVANEAGGQCPRASMSTGNAKQVAHGSTTTNKEINLQELNDYMRQQRQQRQANRAKIEAEWGTVNMDQIVADAEKEQKKAAAGHSSQEQQQQMQLTARQRKLEEDEERKEKEKRSKMTLAELKVYLREQRTLDHGKTMRAPPRVSGINMDAIIAEAEKEIASKSGQNQLQSSFQRQEIEVSEPAAQPTSKRPILPSERARKAAEDSVALAPPVIRQRSSASEGGKPTITKPRKEIFERASSPSLRSRQEAKKQGFSQIRALQSGERKGFPQRMKDVEMVTEMMKARKAERERKEKMEESHDSVVGAKVSESSTAPLDSASDHSVVEEGGREEEEYGYVYEKEEEVSSGVEESVEESKDEESEEEEEEWEENEEESDDEKMEKSKDVIGEEEMKELFRKQREEMKKNRENIRKSSDGCLNADLVPVEAVKRKNPLLSNSGSLQNRAETLREALEKEIGLSRLLELTNGEGEREEFLQKCSEETALLAQELWDIEGVLH